MKKEDEDVLREVAAVEREQYIKDNMELITNGIIDQFSNFSKECVISHMVELKLDNIRLEKQLEFEKESVNRLLEENKKIDENLEKSIKINEKIIRNITHYCTRVTPRPPSNKPDIERIDNYMYMNFGVNYQGE